MGLIEFYQEFIGFFPSYFGTFLNLLILVLLVVVYAIFVWKFYKSISRKNFLGLDLNKYNKSRESFGTKLIAGFLYFIEYIIISPLIIFMGYFVFTFFMIIFTQNQETSQILTVSAVVIAAIRMTSYYKEELSQDLAKLLPFTLLAVALLNPNTFLQTQYFEAVITNLTQIPSLLSQIISYLFFIIILEIILRFFDFIFSLFGLEEESEEKKE